MIGPDGATGAEGWRAPLVEMAIGLALPVIAAVLTWVIIREVSKNAGLG